MLAGTDESQQPPHDGPVGRHPAPHLGRHTSSHPTIPHLGVRLAGAQERQQPPHDGLEFGSFKCIQQVGHFEQIDQTGHQAEAPRWQRKAVSVDPL
eukprot:358775-Chlamydomonas_euryale.AAC.1